MNPFSHADFVSSPARPDTLDSPALWLIFADDKLIVREDEEGKIDLPSTIDPGAMGLQPLRTQYMGYLNGAALPSHCFSGELAAGTALPAGYAARPVRSLFGRVDDLSLALAGRAFQFMNWDRNHQFCGRCGAPTQVVAGEWARRCPACQLSSYPRLSPAIIIAVTRMTAGGQRLLLVRNQRFPAGRYSVVAGFVEPGESLEECCAREVREEVGIAIKDIRYFGSQPWPFPDSLMLGFTAEYAGGELELEEAEIADARWFAADALPQVPPIISIARRLINWFVAANGVDPATLPDW